MNYCTPKCKITLNKPVKLVTTGHMLNLANAATCLMHGYSPFDCHCDIESGVAYIMGFYQAKQEVNHCSTPTAVDMILEDLVDCLNHVKTYHDPINQAKESA